MCIYYIIDGYSGTDWGGSGMGTDWDGSGRGQAYSRIRSDPISFSFFWKKKIRIRPDDRKNIRISDPFEAGNESDTDGSTEMAIPTFTMPKIVRIERHAPIFSAITTPSFFTSFILSKNHCLLLKAKSQTIKICMQIDLVQLWADHYKFNIYQKYLSVTGIYFHDECNPSKA